MVEFADGLEAALQLLVIVQPPAHLGNLFAPQAELAGAPTGIAHRQNGNRMPFAARALRAAAGMANPALQQRAAQDVAGDRKAVEELIARPNGFLPIHLQR